MRQSLFAICFLSCCLGSAFAQSASERPPNFVIVLTDDQGYSDLGCFGAKDFATPNIDKLAAEGKRFTSFYVTSSACSPSRASLMTGCYPNRVGIDHFVFFPSVGEHPGPGPNGLHPNEFTIAELLKTKGYSTCCVGKWHLGDAGPFLPTRQGFEEYFGLPYSNDMWNGPKGPNQPLGKGNPPLPLYDGEKIIETDPDQRFLTRRYTERAVDFIKRNSGKPFLLYLAHSMPHVPLYVHPDFEGKSENGLYGDVIQEIDWSVGEIMKTLEECRIENNTLVVFTSDNGPWLMMGKHGGKAHNLRDGKRTRYEGGHRVPCVMRYPGKIAPGSSSNEMIGSIDLFPSIARLANASDAVPKDRVLDGIEAWDFLSGKIGSDGKETESPRKTFFYNKSVVRHGKWKLFLPGDYTEFQPERLLYHNVKYDKPRLYDLDNDLAETTDLSEKNPEVLAELSGLLETFNADLKKNSRPLGIAKNLRDTDM